jgi:hypothetical protein
MLGRRITAVVFLVALSGALGALPAQADSEPPPQPDRERCAGQSFGFENFTVCQRVRDDHPASPRTAVDVYGVRSAIELPPEPAAYQLWYQPNGGQPLLLAEGVFGEQWVESTPKAPYTVACGASGIALLRMRWSGFTVWTDFIRTENLRIRCG